MVVVLPAPFGPSSPKNSPLGIEKEILSTARKLPKRFVNPVASTAYWEVIAWPCQSYLRVSLILSVFVV
jgi:hypothetical protein